MDEYESAYIEIVKDKNEAAEYRKMRKENRGRWVGGGFGVEGAVKGAVTAGAANLASGIAHSAFNAVGNAVSSVSANIRKDKLYNNINTLSLVESGLSVSMCEVLNVIANIAYINGLEIVMPDKSKDFLNHCDAIIDNIENGYLSDKERIYEECGLILMKNPYYVKAYNLLLQKFGDKLGGIYQMAKYFGLKSIVKSRKEQFDKMLAEINLSSSQGIKNSAEKITRYAEQNGSMSMCASEALRFILQNIVVKSIEENKLPDDADKITGIEFDSSNITNTDIEVVDKIINILIDDDENETAVENAIKGWQDFEKKRMSDDEVINVRYSNLKLKSDEELKKLKESVKAEILLDENIKKCVELINSEIKRRGDQSIIDNINSDIEGYEGMTLSEIEKLNKRLRDLYPAELRTEAEIKLQTKELIEKEKSIQELGYDELLAEENRVKEYHASDEKKKYLEILDQKIISFQDEECKCLIADIEDKELEAINSIVCKIQGYRDYIKDKYYITAKQVLESKIENHIATCFGNIELLEYKKCLEIENYLSSVEKYLDNQTLAKYRERVISRKNNYINEKATELRNKYNTLASLGMIVDDETRKKYEKLIEIEEYDQVIFVKLDVVLNEIEGFAITLKNIYYLKKGNSDKMPISMFSQFVSQSKKGALGKTTFSILAQYKTGILFELVNKCDENTALYIVNALNAYIRDLPSDLLSDDGCKQGGIDEITDRCYGYPLVNAIQFIFGKVFQQPNGISSAKPNIVKGLNIPEQENVIFAHDATLLGNGKNGFALTDKGIYSRGMLEKNSCITPYELLKNAKKFEWKDTGKTILMRDGGFLLYFCAPGKSELIYDAIILLHKYLNGESIEGLTDHRGVYCTKCGQLILDDSLYCFKCGNKIR